jgi:hypothetical protein
MYLQVEGASLGALEEVVGCQEVVHLGCSPLTTLMMTNGNQGSSMAEGGHPEVEAGEEVF